MTTALIGALKAGLSLWDHKEKHKYIDKVLKLEKDYYEEDNKERPDHARLDNIDWELRLICEVFSSKVGKTNA